MKKTTRLKELITRPQLDFLMEAHNGLSAKIVEEAGFDGIWGSGLSISAALGVRDNNEASWTQVLDVVEFMSDATSIPLLLDGDTGYGNFNNFRRLVRKLEQRGCAGVCIEDKLFPKTNSFIDSNQQPLADIDEFSGKIKAGKEAQLDDDFCIVARVEAFIAGWGVEEALKRAEAYRLAGADAILMHSKVSTADEVLAFKKEWGDRHPVIIVPTKYYRTPTEAFRKAGFSVAIWANHICRGAARAMKDIAQQIYQDQHLMGIEEQIIPVAELFRLQGASELQEAEKAYLPTKGKKVSAIVLAASRGSAFGALTQDIPKAMLPVRGQPLLQRLTTSLNDVGIKDISVVRGYKAEAVNLPNIQYFDNTEYETTKELYSLSVAQDALKETCLISFGDILYRKHISAALLENDAELVLAIDPNWQSSRNQGRYADFVACDHPYDMLQLDQEIKLTQMRTKGDGETFDGEWIGLLKASPIAVGWIREAIAQMEKEGTLKTARMADLFSLLLSQGRSIGVEYTPGNWLDLDELTDLKDAGSF